MAIRIHTSNMVTNGHFEILQTTWVPLSLSLISQEPLLEAQVQCFLGEVACEQGTRCQVEELSFCGHCGSGQGSPNTGVEGLVS